MIRKDMKKFITFVRYSPDFLDILTHYETPSIENPQETPM